MPNPRYICYCSPKTAVRHAFRSNGSTPAFRGCSKMLHINRTRERKRRPLVDDLVIPPFHELDVHVRLHRKVLPPVHPVPQVTREDRAEGQRRVNREVIYPVFIHARRLVGIGVTRPPRRDGALTVDPDAHLVDHGDPHPLGRCRPSEYRLDGAGALVVPVRCDDDEYQALTPPRADGDAAADGVAPPPSSLVGDDAVRRRIPESGPLPASSSSTVAMVRRTVAVIVGALAVKLKI